MLEEFTSETTIPLSRSSVEILSCEDHVSPLSVEKCEYNPIANEPEPLRVKIKVPSLSIAIPGSPPCSDKISPVQVSLPLQLVPPSVVT